MLLYICTKFHKNSIDGFKVIEQTRFSFEKFQRGIISTKIVGGVTVQIICTLFDTSFFSAHFHENSFDGF